MYALNQSGFDVLTVDKRGHGISGGLNDTDTTEQAEDIFRMLDQLEPGDGLRILTPTGELLIGTQVAEAYKRATGLKEIVVVRGPHSENEFEEQNIAYLIERMVAFAKRAVLGIGVEKPGPADLKEVVCSSPPNWEPPSTP